MNKPNWLDHPRLSQYLMGIVLLLSVVMLLPGLGGQGLWDPWEMNPAHLARTASGPPVVFIAADRTETGYGNLSMLSQQQETLDASVEWFSGGAKASRKANHLAGRLSRVRTAISKTDFHVVVLPVESADVVDKKNTTLLREFVQHLKRQLPGTKLVFLGPAAEEAAALSEDAGLTATAVTDTSGLTKQLRSYSWLPGSLLRVRSGNRVSGVPPLKYWLMGVSFKIFGQNEFAARLPGALLGILVVLLVFYFGWTLAGPWAGALAALVILGTPYLPVQARNLGGEVGFIAYLGLGALAIEHCLRRVWIVGVGLFGLAFLLLLLDKGLFGPMLLTLLVGSFAIMEGKKERGVALLAGASLVILALLSYWALTSPEWSFLSHFRFMHQSFEGGPGVQDRSFDFFMLQTGFAFLPWIAVVPFALSWMARKWWAEDETKPVLGLVVLWAAIPFVVVSATVLRFGHCVYPGGPAIAIAVGVFGCAMMRKEGPWPLRALFIALTLFLLVKELKLSAHPLVSTVTWDPTFIFEFKELHPGTVYPSEVMAPDLLRKCVYLFLLFGVYAVMHGGTLIERLVTWSRNASRYFGVLHIFVILWFVLLTALVWMTSFGSVQFLEIGSRGELSLQQQISMSFVDLQLPSRILILLFLAGYGLYSLSRVPSVRYGLVHARTVGSDLFGVLMLALGVHPRQVESADSSSGIGGDSDGARGAALAFLVLGVAVGAAGFIFVLVDSRGSAAWALASPLVLALFMAILLFLVRELLLAGNRLTPNFLERALLLSGCTLVVLGSSALHGAGRPLLMVICLVLGYPCFHLLWRDILRVPAWRRAAFLFGLTLFFLPLFGYWSSILEWASAKGHPTLEALLTEKIISGLVVIQTVFLLGWWMLGWFRGQPVFRERYGIRRDRLLAAGTAGLALLFFALARAMPTSVLHPYVFNGLAIVFSVQFAIHLLTWALHSELRALVPWVSRVQFGLEKPKVFLPILAFLGLCVSGMVTYRYMPELAQHVSQKNILQRYLDLEGRDELGPNIFRHGQFSGARAKRNFYVQSVPNVRDAKAALSLLKGKTDLAVPLNASPFLKLPESVVFRAFDAKNDLNKDGKRDFNADAGVASLVEGQRLVDPSRSWKDNQWVGYLLFDAREQTRTARRIVRNDSTSLTYSGPKMQHKVGAPKGFYRIDHANAKNHLATAMDEGRAYLMIPKSDFSALNHKYRKSNAGKSIVVLDDRSSQVVLAASELRDGEENLNWMASAILSEAQFKKTEGVVPAEINFDNKVNLIGFKVHEKKVKRGTTAKVTLFFKLKAGLARSWKVFVHVERKGGNRIGSDHWVLNQSEEQKSCVGCFKTNQWMVGDIVADTFDVKVPAMHPGGRYRVYFGLYDPNANQRLQIMKVKAPIKVHDHRAGPAGSFLVY